MASNLLELCQRRVMGEMFCEDYPWEEVVATLEGGHTAGLAVRELYEHLDAGDLLRQMESEMYSLMLFAAEVAALIQSTKGGKK